MNSPGIDFPWSRRIRVTFGGLTGGDGTKKYECDGTQAGIRATAKVHKIIQGIPSATNLMLWNLSRETRDSFQRGKTTVRIEAGWDHGPFSGELRQCFYGSLMAASSMRAGSDIVTSVNAISVVDDLTMISIMKTWPPMTPVKDMLVELAKTLPGVRIDAARIKWMDGMKVAEKGWTHADTVRNAFERLSSEFGFSWTICDGYFQACKDLESLGGNANVRDPYLIDVNPVFSGIGLMQLAIAIRVRRTFDATVNPMFGMNLESRVEPKYNGGGYVVKTVDHDLGCFAGDAFMTTINAAMEPGKAAAVNGI